MNISSEYISIGCNRASSITDSTAAGLVAFGAGKFVALWDSTEPTKKGVYATLPGHEANITALKFMSNNSENGMERLITGDESGEVKIWEYETSTKLFQITYSLPSTSPNPKTSISSLGAISPSTNTSSNPGSNLFLVGSSSGSIHLYTLPPSTSSTAAAASSSSSSKPKPTVELVQELDIKTGRIPLDLTLSYLPNSSNEMILGIATTSRVIQLWTTSTLTSPSSTATPTSTTNGKPRFTFSHALTLEGHEDWIRCLSIAFCPSTTDSGDKDVKEDLMLASGSQDSYIRLWRIAESPVGEEIVPAKEKIEAETKVAKGDGNDDQEDQDDLLDEFERKLAGDAGGGSESKQLSTKSHLIRVGGVDGESKQYIINLETLLIGHEGWVTNLHWSPATSAKTSAQKQQPLLLSTAADNSMIVWVPPAPVEEGMTSAGGAESIWLAHHRFGEMGGRGLGLFGAIWVPEMLKESVVGMSVLANGWNGGFQRWRLQTSEEFMEDLDLVNGIWDPEVAPTGHGLGVKSLSWDSAEEYLVSVSTDQTTRIHAPWNREPSLTTWAELARPQIHGYDLTCIAFLDRLRFVSGADEKLVRVFDAPRGFVESLGKLGVTQDDLGASTRSVGAVVPPLALSNRALAQESTEPAAPSKDPLNQEHVSVSEAFSQLPTEGILASSTLWPEIEKLYGHGYELMACATSHQGDLIATSCKATNAEHAVVRLYDTKTWKQLGTILEGHNLTITRITFSHDDRYILTCSRDRTWRLFVRNDLGYEAVAAEKPHARIIWDCAWAPDDTYFVTVSRDKLVKLWSRAAAGSDGKWVAVASLKLKEAVTAVDIIRLEDKGFDLLAAGMEDGTIALFSVSTSDPSQVKPLHVIGQSQAHVDHISRMAWRKHQGKLQLASCSEDRSVRILNVEL